MTDLREQIANEVHHSKPTHNGCSGCNRTADAVMAVVRPALAAKDDEIMRLRLAQNVAAVLARYRRRQAHAKLLAARKVAMANAAARREDYVWLTREQGLTLAQAADRLGITERTAERYEATARQEIAP